MIDFSHLKHSAEDYRDRPSEAGFEELASAASDDDCGVLALFAELERLKDENKALRKDAKRYRWLRRDTVDLEQFNKAAHVAFDGMIDEAMEKEAAKG